MNDQLLIYRAALLSCPGCGERHIDVGKYAFKPHLRHACQRCGLVFQLTLRGTVGVRYLPGHIDALYCHVCDSKDVHGHGCLIVFCAGSGTLVPQGVSVWNNHIPHATPDVVGTTECPKCSWPIGVVARRDGSLHLLQHSTHDTVTEEDIAQYMLTEFSQGTSATCESKATKTLFKSVMEGQDGSE